MKEKYKEQLTLILTGFFIIALGILFFFLIFRADSVRRAIGSLIGILMPFVYGVVIAYLLRPTCNFFEKNLRILSRKLWKKERRGLCVGLSIALSFILFFLIVYLLLAMMIPQLLHSIRVISVRIPLFLEVVQEWIDRLFSDNQVLSSYLGDSVEDIEATLREWIQGSLLPSLNNVMDNFTNGVMGAFNLLYNLFVGVVAAVYILVSRKRFAAQSKLILYGSLKTHVADWIYQEVCYADRMFSGFLAGKILDSTIIGMICFIACSILNIPNTMLVSVIVGITNIIPFFGPYIGGVPSALIILMESPVKCVWFSILIVILQQIDGNILGPRILGNSTGLSGFWVLFSIILFSGLFGFVGMIIGVPLFAIIYDIVRRAVCYGLEQRGKEEMMEQYKDRFHREERRQRREKGQ